MHKNFSFKGTVRSNDNILAGDGECMELVNLRMVNGSLRPIPEARTVTTLSVAYRDIYKHEKAQCYLCLEEEGCWSVDFYDSNWKLLTDDNGDKLHFPLLEDVTAIEFLGYIVVCITAKGIYYLLYSNGTYRFLGNRPEIPELSITLSSKVHELVTESSFTTSHVDTDISSTWWYNARGYFDECIYEGNRQGYYVDRALFRFALRLYDGSYIYCSHIMYVGDESIIEGVSRDSGNLVANPVGSSSTSSTYRVKVLGFTPSFGFKNLKLDDWEGVIVGIDVFTTGSIMGKKIGESTTTLLDTETKRRVTEKYETYQDKKLDELWEEINDASLFYKVAEFDIYGNCLNKVTDVSQSNLVLQNALSSYDANPTLSTPVPDCCYMFNNRLHIGALREDFFKGYDHSAFAPAGIQTVVVETLAIRTMIRTQNGISAVVSRFNNVELGYRNGNVEIAPLIAYPDSRAFEMYIYVRYNSQTYMKKFLLTPHKMLNLAQYLHKWYLGFTVTVTSYFKNGGNVAYISPEDVLKIFNNEIGEHQVIYSQTSAGWTYKGSDFPPEEYSSFRIFAIPENIANGDKIVFNIKKGVSNTNFRDVNNIPVDVTWTSVPGLDSCKEENPYEFKNNVIKVSMVDNPFLFPAKSTYSLSHGRVIAFSTNRVAISEGQFGEHPLYVFSNEGISVMSVDVSGSVAYSSIYPVSHEVCLYPSTICGTDSGVIFLGQREVMMISGGRCISISSSMNDDSQEEKVCENSDIVERIASLRRLEHAVATGEFLDYMRNAKVFRNPEMNEIIFCNVDFRFSFIYSLSDRIWSKISRPYMGNVRNSIPFLLFSHDGSETTVLQSGGSVMGKGDVFLITRPQPFGTKMPKRIMQLMLHAYLSKPDDTAADDAFFSCFLLCSNDGLNFRIVSGCEKSRDIQDVVFPYFPTSSYRYYMFALVGRLNAVSMITGLELDVSFAWNNRLR